MEEMTASVVSCLAVVREAHTIVRICLHYISSFSCLMMRCLLVGVGQVSLEELGHTEGTNLVLSEDGDHLGVGSEVLLVLGVLQLVGLDVGPEPLDHLGPGELLVLLGADQVSQLLGESEGFGESGSLGHLEFLGLDSLYIMSV